MHCLGRLASAFIQSPHHQAQSLSLQELPQLKHGPACFFDAVAVCSDSARRPQSSGTQVLEQSSGSLSARQDGPPVIQNSSIHVATVWIPNTLKTACLRLRHLEYQPKKLLSSTPGGVARKGFGVKFRTLQESWPVLGFWSWSRAANLGGNLCFVELQLRDALLRRVETHGSIP